MNTKATDPQEIARGRTYPDVSRLDWLAALIQEMSDVMKREPDAIADHGAMGECLSECRGLLGDLCAAVGEGTADAATAKENGD